MTDPVLTDHDLSLLREGRHDRAYEKLGAHPSCVDGVLGVWFAVVAPNAERVSVVGDFNGWIAEAHPMCARGDSGVWQVFVPDAEPGSLYKYRIRPRQPHADLDKADPFAFAAELPPRTASRVWDLSGYTWGDADWMSDRAGRHTPGAPISIYARESIRWTAHTG